MEALFLKILNMSLTATYVIAAVLLVRLLLKRAPKKYSYLLWAIVLFRLVCPVSISSELSLFNAPLFDMTAAQKSGEASLNYISADIGYMESPRMTVGIPTVNVMISDSLPAADPTDSVNPLRVWIQLGTVLWGIGFIAVLSYAMVSYFTLKRRMDTAVRLDSHIFESDNIRSPFILGFINPRIYIPFGLRDHERVYILQHEAYHLRRKDHLIKPLAFVVLAFHWFNPFVWLSFALMAKDMEMSCDEKVISQTGAGIAKEYCSSLIAFAANRRLPSVSPLAFGETGIRERVTNILRFRTPKKRVIAFSAAVCIAAIAVCATNPVVNGARKETGEPYGSYGFEELPEVQAIVGTQDGVDDFLAIHKGFKSGYDTDKCYNITPKSIKESSDYSIFKYDQSSASFLLYKGEVYPLGEWFGGFGVTSMALSDMDNDGESELYFTYSWGSGLHRSQAAYYSPAAKEIETFEYAHFNEDMALVNNRDGSLSLYEAELSNMSDFANFGTKRTDFITDIVYADGKIILNDV